MTEPSPKTSTSSLNSLNSPDSQTETGKNQTLKILVPIDFTHPNHSSAELLAELVPMKNAEVELLYVREELPSYESVLTSMADFPEDWRHQVNEKAIQLLQSIEADFAGKCQKITKRVEGGIPASIIQTVAKQDSFDVTVLNPGRHSALGKLLLGTVTGKVVAHGSGTILILRTHAPESVPLKKVVFAVDGSEQAFYAVSKMASMLNLQERDVKIILVNIVSVLKLWTFISPVAFVGAIKENLMMAGEAALARAKAILAEQGVTNNVEIVLKEGDPAEEILLLAEKRHVDLIVTGAHGHSAVEHMLGIGSVSQRIATNAPCSVAVVKSNPKV